MAFKVLDLMTRLTPVGVDGDTCSGVTRINTSCKIDSLYAQTGDGTAASRSLATLRAQLREVMDRAA